MKSLKLVQVGTDVLLGTVEGSSLKGAIDTPLDSITSEVSKHVCAQYLVSKERGKLTTMNIGTADTVSSRSLTEDELHLLEEVNYVFDRARKSALSNLIVREFNDLLGK